MEKAINLLKKCYIFFCSIKSSLYCHLLGCHNGRNVIVGKRVKIRHGECVSLGDDVFIAEGCHLRSEGGEARITLGAKTVLAHGVMLLQQIPF